jgi:putative ABC transport system permease protein
LRIVYSAQLALIGGGSSVLGVALGASLQQVLIAMILPPTATPLPAPGWTPVVVAVASGLVALAAASLPALLRLIRVSPLRVLRRELPPLPVAAWLGVVISAALLLALMVWYARDAKLVALFVAALAALALVLALLAQLALLLGRGVQTLAHGPLRFGLSQLLRHRLDSTLQLGAFTLALFLLGLLALVRSDLIATWRQQLPPDAPNYFLVNIAPAQATAVTAYFNAQRLHPSALYPMVRGRLTGKNGTAIEATLPPAKRNAESLRRELNLTWSATLAANNRIVVGHWHGDARVNAISVEAGMAKELDLKLGDVLTFVIGDQTVSARIGSIRSVQWQSMQPNFYVIFAPGQLDALPTNFIASVYVPPAHSAVMPGFVAHFPGVTVIALGALIANLVAIIGQVVVAIQLLLGFLLAAGIAVVFATLLAGLDARQHEAVLLRTLGAQSRYLRSSLASEFIVLGLLAGLLASACAEIAMAIIAEHLFDLSLQFHPWLWLALPLAGASLIGASGWLVTRHITRVPPMQSLRALG